MIQAEREMNKKNITIKSKYTINHACVLSVQQLFQTLPFDALVPCDFKYSSFMNQKKNYLLFTILMFHEHEEEKAIPSKPDTQ